MLDKWKKYYQEGPKDILSGLPLTMKCFIFLCLASIWRCVHFTRCWLLVSHMDLAIKMVTGQFRGHVSSLLPLHSRIAVFSCFQLNTSTYRSRFEKSSYSDGWKRECRSGIHQQLKRPKIKPSTRFLDEYCNACVSAITETRLVNNVNLRWSLGACRRS